MKHRFLSALAGLTLLLTSMLAPAADADYSQLLATLRARFPEIKLVRVAPSPWPGMVEVYTPSELVYASEDGKLLFVGKVVDTVTRDDLTAKSLGESQRIDFNELPLEDAIKLVKGNGSRKLAIFEDPRCPFCQQLDKTLQDVDDLTVYLFLFPLEDLHPGATVTSQRIWCSSDRAAAWTQWMQTKQEPATATCEHTPISDLAKLGEKLKVNSTPTLFMPDGSRIPGAVERSVIESRLKQQSNAG
jgi:thiol:disulfide interchange protein DsbC